MANKQNSKGAEAASSNYKSSRKWETNRLARLLRAQKKNPENTQIALAMKSIVWRRKTPKAREWSHSERATAVLFKRFAGKVNKDMFNSNEKISGPALMMHGKYKDDKKQVFEQHRMFSLGQRAHSGTGTAVWS